MKKNIQPIAGESPAGDDTTADGDSSGTMKRKEDSFLAPLDSCPLCGSGKISHAHTITSYSAPFKIDRCGSCRFMFMNPRFSDETIRDFYGEEYYGGGAEYTYYDERKAERFAHHVWDKRIAVIRKHIRSGRLLDVGCSFGGFLRAAAPFFETSGIEISPYAGEYARKRMGSKIHVGTLDDHIFVNDNFLVITMIEVLEHIPNPAEALRECCRLLQKGGLLVIQTANMDGLQARIQGERYAYFMPGHLSYFTKKGLIAALREAGFTRFKVFQPVEFGLLPKLRKSRGDFRSILDYLRWFKIVGYHLLSKIHVGNFSSTSSMVIYAFK